ncbi:MAG: glycyl-radical enzyme activating protein [Bacteroidales bacterium]|nr:glycyl-radical enzyme activating protein [Bacteroidales bacterium]
MPLIFDIKRYAIHDGPGIRTTLFLKGCPLRCIWCHNPESWSPLPQKLYKQSRCIGCSSCVAVCPNGALALTPDGIRPTGNPCILCGTCIRECPSKALEMSGEQWGMEELMAEVEKERGVMERSGGGVTLCGGEPLMHPSETLALLQELGRRGFHRAVDTTLYAAEDVVRQTATHCELFLVDLKLMDSTLHARYTGVPNESILENIRLIADLGATFRIRIPLIVGINADDANLEASARFLASLPRLPEGVDLLPYHDIGKGKHARMGTTYNPEGIPMATPSDAELQHARTVFTAFGLPVS